MSFEILMRKPIAILYRLATLLNTPFEYYQIAKTSYKVFP